MKSKRHRHREPAPSSTFHGAQTRGSNMRVRSPAGEFSGYAKWGAKKELGRVLRTTPSASGQRSSSTAMPAASPKRKRLHFFKKALQHERERQKNGHCGQCARGSTTQ
eukprot:2688423-Amphidinium_carterae.1